MTKREDDTTLSLTTTVLALPSVGVLFLSDMLNWSFAWPGATPILAKLTFAASRIEASNRLLVLAAALVGFGLAYLIILRFIADLRDEFGPRMRRWILSWYGGGELFGACWVLSGCWQVPVENQLGNGFTENALRLFGAASGGPDDALFGSFLTLALCSRLVFMLAAGIVVTGGISSLVTPIRPLEGDEFYAFLIHQRRRLRNYVNAAAALLVVCLVFQLAWMRWLLVALDPSNAPILKGHVDSFAIFTGVTGSVVIALFAVPASTILSARVAALPRPPGAAPDAPLLDAGLLSSLGKILVILAPTLAGSLPAVLDLLGKP